LKLLAMRLGRIVGMLVLASLGGTACRKKPPELPQATIPLRADGQIELRLATFNIRYENEGDRDLRNWRARLSPVVKTVRAMQPDVFGVQEALHGQVADLRASLPEFDFQGIGRDDGKEAGEYSGIFFRADRFQTDRGDSGTFWLSDMPETPGSRTWGNEIPRIATWLRLIDRSTGRGFYVFNTHWDHKNQPSRERAALLLAHRIDGRKQRREPVVLLGDFNAVEDNPAVAYLRGRQVTLAGKKQTWTNGLIDAFDTLSPGKGNRTTLHFWSGNREGNRNVDHIMVSPDAKLIAADIYTGKAPWPSDHFPVTARVVFAPNG
jgi:endonuclease/exonuclease/phosphatase family metal-dependent hydrolase